MVKVSKARQKEATQFLREMLKPGDEVYTYLRHVSASGMTRLIRVVIIRDNQPRDISYTVAHALNWTYDEKREAIKVQGCGMDMGFHLVYTLSSVLFPDGFDCPGEKCQGSEHFNEHAPYDERIHHQDGGYALKQRWL